MQPVAFVPQEVAVGLRVDRQGVLEAAGVDDVSSASPAAATADASVTGQPAGGGQ